MNHGNAFPSQHFPVKCDAAYGTAVPYCTREMILGHANCRTAPTEQQHFSFFIIASLHEEIRACFTLRVLVPSCSLKEFNDSHLNSSLTLNSIKSRTENYVLKGGVQQQDQVVKLQRALRGEVYPLSYRVPVRERYGSTLLPATREQHDQNCTQSH